MSKNLLHETKNIETRESMRSQLSSYICQRSRTERLCSICKAWSIQCSILWAIYSRNHREINQLNKTYYYRVSGVSVLCTFLRMRADEYFTIISTCCTNDHRHISIFNGCWFNVTVSKSNLLKVILGGGITLNFLRGLKAESATDPRIQETCIMG